eukprot:TRINITY_DN302_c1_g1_i2.p1 TRINITY_DN302_c1_g1~~TRINITY_DN302_c1_g1_i2.p1  ORF type:complete len:723 (+),score=190.54 TRINITY_DN302_c1_g1_i2:180-2171(+)
MTRGVNGIPQLQPAFRNIDIDREKRSDIWEFKSALRDQGLKLSDRELDVLFTYYDHDCCGEIDIDDFLAEVRGKLSCTQQQVDDILRKVRSKIRGPAGVEKIFAGIDTSSDVLLSNMAFNRCLKRSRKALGLSPSDVTFLFRSLQENGRVSLYRLMDCFERPSTEQILQTILLKLRDATEDRERTHSGCIGLSRMLTRSGGQKMDLDRFKQGMKNFGCGLRDGEIDILFEAISEHGMVRVKGLLSILQEDPIPASEEEVEYLLQKLNRELITRQVNGIVQFRMRCEDAAKDGDLTMHALGGVVRDMLTASQVPDLEVEILFNAHSSDGEALDLEPFMASVRGYLPPAREEIIRQTWKKIDVEDRDEVNSDTFLAAFKPELLPDVQCGRVTASDAYSEIVNYLDLERYEMVSKDSFYSYWADVSASVDTDKNFTLVMWNSFEINRMKKSNAQGDRNHAPVTASPTIASPAAQVKHRSVERAQQRRINPTTDPCRQARHEDADEDEGLRVEQASPVKSPLKLSRRRESRERDIVPPAAALLEEYVSPERTVPQSPPAQQQLQQPPPSTSSVGPAGTSPSTGRRFVSSQGFGGGRSTLNLFGGGEDTPPVSARRHMDPNTRSTQGQSQQRQVPQEQRQGSKGSITGCGVRGTTAHGRRQLHTERPF